MSLPLSLRARLFVGCAALLICAAPREAAAQAKAWHRVGTVTTQTANQICYTNGTDIVCDSNAPTLSGTSVGIGSTAPVSSLDMSQMTDALALPSGSSAQRPTGGNLVNGEIRYNSGGTGQVEAYYNGAWNSLVTSASVGTATPAAGSNGQVQFNSGGYLGASSNFYWDNTSGRVGIGTTSPLSPLNVSADAPQLNNLNSNANTAQLIILGHSNTNQRLYLGYDTTNNQGVIAAGLTGTAWEPLLLNPAGGNVGIGTTSPAWPLDVHNAGNSIAGIFGGSTAGAVGFGTVSSTPFIQGYTSDAASSATNLSLQPSGGNVGIGTTSPTHELTVVNPSSPTYSSFNVQTMSGAAPFFGATAGVGLGFDYTGSTVGGIYLNNSALLTMANSAGATIQFSGASVLLNPTTGNVGIGTTVPSALLHLLGAEDDNNGQLKIQVTNGSTNTNAGLSLWTKASGANANSRNWQITTNYNAFGDLEFLRSTSNTGNPTTNAMTLDLNGNVGIGTTSPNAWMTIDSYSGNSNNLIRAYSTYTGGTGTAGFVSQNGTREWFAGVDWPGPLANNYEIYDVTANASRLDINQSGYVGIGTAAPATALVISKTDATINPSLANTSALTLANPSVAYGAGPEILFSSATGTNNIAAGIGFYDATSNGTGTTGDIVFATKPTVGATSLSEDMRIQGATGNVGIRTTAPTAPLQVNSGSYALPATSGTTQFGAFQRLTANGGVTLDFGYAGSGLAWIQNSTTADLSTTWPLALNPNGGNVGIGMTSPGSALQVNGGAAVGYSTNTAAPSNGMLVSGQVGIGTASPASDVKADINGAVKVAGSGSETCATTADIGKFRYNQALGYFELCSP